MEYVLKVGNRTRKLNIEIVPYAAHKMDTELKMKTETLQFLAEDERILNQRVLELRTSKPDGWFGEVRGLRKELRGLQKEAKELVDEMFFTDRFNMVKLILSKNGVKDDDVLMDRELWEESIDASVITDFINKCILGDKGKKE